MIKLTLGSLFDGIGGWQIAARHAEIDPVWSSEIEAYPMAVTAKHFPTTEQLGDITKIDVNALTSVDIICAGSPCQDLSVAGGRKGLDGERSGLFKTAVKIVHAMRKRTKGKYPRFFVWENVPGAFSSNKGADFRAVLEKIGESKIPMPTNGRWATAGLARLPNCEIAWRVLDAQYFGVPQRRRRIFLVADFGRSQRCAGEILFEQASLSGNTASSENSRQKATDGARNSPTSSGRFWDGGELCSTLTAHNAGGNQYMPDKNNFTAVLTKQNAYNISAYNSNSMLSPNPNSGIQNVTTARTLDLNGGNPACNQGGIMITEKSYSIGNGQVANLRMLEEKADTLNCMHDQLAVAVPKKASSVETKYDVRRLTPREAERLQGLPDDYTLLEDRVCSDSARYKALGNGMAQPCADFVLRRLKEAVERHET